MKDLTTFFIAFFTPFPAFILFFIFLRKISGMYHSFLLYLTCMLLTKVLGVLCIFYFQTDHIVENWNIIMRYYLVLYMFFRWGMFIDHHRLLKFCIWGKGLVFLTEAAFTGALWTLNGVGAMTYSWILSSATLALLSIQFLNRFVLDKRFGKYLKLPQFIIIFSFFFYSMINLLVSIFLQFQYNFSQDFLFTVFMILVYSELLVMGIIFSVAVILMPKNKSYAFYI